MVSAPRARLTDTGVHQAGQDPLSVGPQHRYAGRRPRPEAAPGPGRADDAPGDHDHRVLGDLARQGVEQRPVEGGPERGHPRRLRRVGPRHPPCRESGGLDRERLPHLVQVLHVGPLHPPHPDPAVRQQLQEPFAHQGAQRLADRDAGHPQFLGDLALHEAGALRVPAVDDPLPDRVPRVGAERRALRGARSLPGPSCRARFRPALLPATYAILRCACPRPRIRGPGGVRPCPVPGRPEGRAPS